MNEYNKKETDKEDESLDFFVNENSNVQENTRCYRKKNYSYKINYIVIKHVLVPHCVE